MYGASITLVEPHQMMHKSIKTLFSDKSLIDHLIKIDAKTLENYQDKYQYDLVIAEGFINALPDRLEVVRNLCSFSSNFVVFSYIEKSGVFFDSLKRALFRRLIDLYDINENNWGQIIKLARRVFLSSFNKLKSARTFDSWVKDILLNPCGTLKGCDSFDQFFPIFQKLDFDYYSSSPQWDLRNSHKWYKNTSTIRLKEEYLKNIPFFLSGSKDDQITSEGIKLILSMTGFFLDYSSGLKEFSHIQSLKRLSPSSWQYANEVNKLLNLLFKDEPEHIISFYTQSKLYDMWGMPSHYVCLKKKST